MKPVLSIICNSHRYFVEHKADLYKTLENDFDLVLLTGEFDPDQSNRFISKVMGLPIRRYLHLSIGDILAMLRLAMFFRNRKPVVITAITMKGNLVASAGYVLSRLIGGRPTPVFLLFPGLGRAFGARKGSVFQRLRFRLLTAYLRWFVRTYDCRCVFENHRDCNTFISIGIVDPSKTKVIRGTGIDLDVGREEKTQDGRLRVVFAGRMLKSKGAQLLAEAAKQVTDPDSIHIAFFGASDPSERDGLNLAEVGLTSAMTYRGGVSIEEVYEALRKAHCVCLPTLYREGLPRVLLEGAAHECALISTNMPGCSEIVQDGVTGRLITQRDPAAITRALTEILDAMAKDRSMVIEWGKNARKAVEDGGFSAERVRDEFQSVLTERGPHKPGGPPGS